MSTLDHEEKQRVINDTLSQKIESLQNLLDQLGLNITEALAGLDDRLETVEIEYPDPENEAIIHIKRVSGE